MILSLIYCCMLSCLFLSSLRSCRGNVQKTLEMLEKTELHVTTYKQDAGLLFLLWQSIALFVPKLRGIVIVLAEEDLDTMMGILPPPSFPFPVRTVVVSKGSEYRLKAAPKTYQELDCVEMQFYANPLGVIQTQLWSYFGDKYSPFQDTEYILYVESDFIFTSFDWLRYSGFDDSGRPIQYLIQYDQLDPKHKENYKASIDFLLGVDNHHEYMTKLPIIIRKSMLPSFRTKMIEQVPGAQSITHLIQTHYVDNRVCEEDGGLAFAKYGGLSSYNLLLAYTYHYEQDTMIWSKNSSADWTSDHIHGHSAQHKGNLEAYIEFQSRQMAKHLNCEDPKDETCNNNYHISIV